MQMVRQVIVWTALVAVVLVVGFSMSEGAPVCEGPFILRVDDSLPLQCEPPSQVLPPALVVWAVGLALMVAVKAVPGVGRSETNGRK